tara:strand:- start:678 stop:896 length:219 start_codon:yes stop_codon:yes gene_type:complete
MNYEALQQRIDELESKQAFQEDLLEQLNQQVIEISHYYQQQQKYIQFLGQKLAALTPNQLASEAEETPPPHY